MEEPTPCPNCGGKPIEIEKSGKTLIVQCGHEVCRKAEERRIMVELLRHLPPDLTRKAKR